MTLKDRMVFLTSKVQHIVKFKLVQNLCYSSWNVTITLLL